MPIWISILFLIAIPVPVILIIRLLKKSGASKTLVTAAIIFYLVYFSYVTYLCLNGYFDEESLPPKILVFTMFPLLVVLMSLFLFSKKLNLLLSNLHITDLISVHIFRLIGGFFLILMFHDFLPPVFALIAGIGDLTTALTSIFVVKAIRNDKSYAKPLTWIWNTFGLVDILATSGTAMLLTKLAIENGTPGVDVLTTFPFCFIPAFAPATIIFLHLCIYRKLIGGKN